MKHYTTKKRYCPHEIVTKIHSVCSITIDMRLKKDMDEVIEF